ncbi:hypothetical protein OS187_00475 [Xanthomonadaceae bacterium JHOS43]|nr:hypothetical protein [Xanthomonadaceae bacterium JHOS43]
MVSNPVLRYRPSLAPRDFGTLVQGCFLLWFASLRTTVWPAFGYSLLSQWALLHWWWQTRDIFSDSSARIWLSPATWAPNASAWAIAIATNLAALVCLMVMIRRQGLMARAENEHPDRSITISLKRFGTMLLASLGYLLLNLVALAPLVIAWWLGLGAELLTRLMLVLAGLLLCMVPLAWMSVAASLYAAPILLDEASARSALRESFRLVRHHWVLTASLMTLGILAWSGIYGTIGTVPLTVTAAIAYANGGIDALLRPGWLVWGQMLSVPLMALTLPLLTATYVECVEELRKRHATMPVTT